MTSEANGVGLVDSVNLLVTICEDATTRQTHREHGCAEFVARDNRLLYSRNTKGDTKAGTLGMLEIKRKGRFNDGVQ